MKKQCKNPACSMTGLKIETENEKCIVCNRDLSLAAGLDEFIDEMEKVAGKFRTK